MLLEYRRKRLVGQQSRLFFRDHRKLGIQLKLVKMLAHELQAEAVQGADVGGFKQGKFLLPAWILLVSFQLFFQPRAYPLPDFSRGGLSERDDQDLIKRDRRVF